MNDLLIDFLVQLFFGWPAIITAILLSLAGVWRRKPALLVAAGIVSIPFAYYISSGFRSLELLIPLLLFASAYAVRRQETLFAWILIAPMLVLPLLLAYVVLAQSLAR